jgi:hypothetical protein
VKPVESLKPTVKTGVLMPLVTVILKATNPTNIPVFTVGSKLFTDLTGYLFKSGNLRPVIVTVASLVC